LPHFFHYPLHVNSLIVIVALALGSMLLSGGLLALFLLLFGVAAMIKYSFAIIEQRGSGTTTPPTLAEVLTSDQDHLFLKQMAVLLLMGVIVGLAYQLGELVGILVGGFITLAMPASTMLLAVEKSVGRALNPFAQLSLMTSVGWPYLLLWFCVQIISAGPYYSYDLLSGTLPDLLVMPLLVAISVYFTFVLYTMLGYVLFEYQHELGFESAVDDEPMDAEDFEKAKALGEIAVLIKEGDYIRARTSLRKALDAVRDDIELHQHYHKLLMLLDDNAALTNHAAFFIELAHRKNMLSKAVPVLLDAQTRDPSFQLENTKLALELARLLQQQGKHKAVVRLFHNLHKTKADDPNVPAAYLMVAKIFFEYLNDDAKAKAMVEFLLKKYPKSVQRPQVLQLQESLAKAASLT
jgi:tetratricopeptide (TPR) repeat protein